MPRKAVVAPDVSTAVLYSITFELDPEEWGTYEAKAAYTGRGFDRIVFLIDEHSFRDENRENYHNWSTFLRPGGLMTTLAIR